MKKVLGIVAIAFVLFLPYAHAGCVKGDCMSGYGVFEYPDGGVYMGNFVAGKPHGKGIFNFANGSKYIGHWAENFREGEGRFIYAEGHEYRGHFRRDQFHGFGVLTLINGDRYEGEFFQGLFHGTGTMFYADGRRFSGQWSQGAFVQNVRSDAAAPVHTPPAQGVKIWAVVVGVAQYKHMPVLRYTDDDAYQVFAFLKSPEGGALPESQIRVLIDEDATRYNIQKAMRDVFLRAGENDVVIFYFSGHGLDGSFLPFDYDGQANKLMHEEVSDLISQSRAKHKLILADACHSGSLLAMRSSPIDASLAKLYAAFERSSGGMALFLSSKGEEYSLEDGGLRSGVFSYYLIQGLKGAADLDNNKLITIGELFVYVQQKVQYYTARAQTPVLKGQFDYNMPVGMIRH